MNTTIVVRPDMHVTIQEQEVQDPIEVWADGLDSKSIFDIDVLHRLENAGDAITHGRIRRAVRARAKTLGVKMGDIDSHLKECGVDSYQKIQSAKQVTQQSSLTSPTGFDYTPFLYLDKQGHPTGVKQNETYEYLKKTVPMMVFHKKPYIYEGGVFVRDTDGIKDGVRIRQKIEEIIYPPLRTARIKNLIYDRVVQDPTLIVDEVNTYPLTLINFRNGMYDVVNKCWYAHDPRYRSLNQIPHVYDPNRTYEGGLVEKFLNETLDKPGQKELFLEFIGITMTPNPQIFNFLMLNGQGGNGKSVLLKMFDAVIGKRNLTHVGLDDIAEDKFSKIRLLGMLGNSCGDLRTDRISDCQNLKMLTGNDGLTGQYKGVDSEEFDNYAKLIFSVNGVPKIIGEGSDAVYRRMMVLTIDHKPSKIDLNLSKKLERQIDYFLGLCVKACEQFYARGGFVKCEDSDKAVIRARYNSSSVDAFLAIECYERGDRDDKIERTTLYRAYEQFCEEEGRIKKSARDFYKTLQDKGFDTEFKSNGIRYIRGIKHVPSPEEILKHATVPSVPYIEPVQERVMSDGSIMGMSREQIVEHLSKLQQVQAEVTRQVSALMALMNDNNVR